MKQKGYYDIKDLTPKFIELIARDRELLGSAVQRSVIYQDHQKNFQHCITRIEVLKAGEHPPKPDLIPYAALPLRTEVLSLDDLLARVSMLCESHFQVGQQILDTNRNVNVAESALHSNNPYGTWPGHLFEIDFNNAHLPMDELHDPRLPSYPNPVPAIKAFLKLPKFFNGDGRLGHILLYLPNFRARISDLSLEKQLLTIQLSSTVSLKSLILKITYFSDSGQESLTLSGKNKVQIKLKFDPNALNVWLLTQEGEVIDYQEESLHHFAGINSVLPKLTSLAQPQYLLGTESVNKVANLPARRKAVKRNETSQRRLKIRRSDVSKKIFIIHGHDQAMKESVARFLTKLDLEPVILHEQPDQGRTIIEKFEQHADVPFAVALFSQDDLGGSRAEIKGSKPKSIESLLRPRARQNVVFECGYFIGRLTRSKVVVLHAEGVEMMSDYSGVIYVPFDAADGWHMRLFKELKAAGVEVDADRLF